MAQNPTKVLQKEIKKAETAQKQQLKDAQKAEIKFLKAEGATKAELAAEKAANKTEFAGAKSLLATDGLQYVPQRAENGFIKSNVGTYQDTYASAIQPKIEQAIGLLSQYNIPQAATRSTDNATITTGMSLNNAYALAAAQASGQPITADLLKEQFGSYVSGANRQANIFNAVERFSGDDVITATDFDKKLNPVKGQEGLFTSKIGGGTTGVFQYNPETDSYQYLSATPVKVTENDGGFLGSLGGQLLVGLAGGLLLGPTASLLATGTTTGAATLGSTIAAGGLLGGLGSAITGGDILTGVLTGGIGGGAMFGIGQAGGLGNVINRAGVNLSPRITSALNSLVSGVGAPTAQNAQLAADVLTASGIPTTADDILTSVARESVETGANAPTTYGGYGLTSADPRIAQAVEDAFRNVAFANADEVTQAAINASRAAGQNISLTVPGGEFVLTATPAGLTTQTPFNTFSQTGPVFPSTQAPIEERDINQATPGTGAQNPNIGAGAAAAGLGGAALDALGSVTGLGTAGALAAGAGLIGGINQTPVNTGVGNEKLPAWVYDPAMSGVLPRIQAAQAAMPAPMPNLFDAQFQRGGLGAGQFIGYDLLNRAGDIPAQTLLGVSPLAMPSMNLLGVTGGQAPTSQASLV